MSLLTWMNEYYPLDAEDVSTDQAIAHSLKKWEGLRPDILKAHGLNVGMFGNLVDRNDMVFCVDSSTCALCVLHFNREKDSSAHLDPEEHCCGECPLYLARGNVSCAGEVRDDEAQAPYTRWTNERDPEPMIHWLRKAHEATSHAAAQPATNPKPAIGGLTCETPGLPGILDSTD